MWYIFINAMNDPVDSIRGGIYLLPRIWSVDSFIHVLNNNNVFQPLFISISRTVIGSIAHIAACFIASYCLSKKDLLMRKPFMMIIIFTMYFSGGIIPFYILLMWLGLLNNFLVYIIPTMLNAFNIILIKTYIEQLPESVLEAAEIDGANDFVIMIQIVAPLCKPIIATVALYNAVWQWSSWFDNYLYAGSERSLTTLQFLLVRMLREADAIRQIAQAGGSAAVVRMSAESIRMSVAMIIIIPIFLLYPFLQKYFVKGIMLGAVKG